MLVTEKF